MGGGRGAARVFALLLLFNAHANESQTCGQGVRFEIMESSCFIRLVVTSIKSDCWCYSNLTKANFLAADKLSGFSMQTSRCCLYLHGPHKIFLAPKEPILPLTPVQGTANGAKLTHNEIGLAGWAA